MSNAVKFLTLVLGCCTTQIIAICGALIVLEGGNNATRQSLGMMVFYIALGLAVPILLTCICTTGVSILLSGMSFPMQAISTAIASCVVPGLLFLLMTHDQPNVPNHMAATFFIPTILTAILTSLAARYLFRKAAAKLPEKA